MIRGVNDVEPRRVEVIETDASVADATPATDIVGRGPNPLAAWQPIDDVRHLW